MPTRDIVVVGASAGGVQALTALAAGLPPDFPAAVFVVLHMPPYAESRLPEILGWSTTLPVAHAVDGEAIVGGRIYVAPPDRHLLVRHGRVELGRGPRENRSRPAVDALFRTAARAYGPRVIGVVLSGALYDGSAGLLAITSQGGLAVVQDPEQATIDGMPRSALRLTAVDHVVPTEAMGHLLDVLVREPIPAASRHTNGASPMADQESHMTAVIGGTIDLQADGVRADEVTIFTCPDCGGTLFQDGAPVVRFRCHVGHAYAPEVLLGAKAEEVEEALWRCVRLLTEKATLSRQVARRTVQLGSTQVAGRVEEQAESDERHAMVLRDLLDTLPGPSEATYPVVDGSSG